MALWSYTVGEHGSKVTVYEREPGGVLYRRYWDGGSYCRASLRTRDKARAKRKAHRLAEKLAEVRSPSRRTTLGDVIDLYLKHQTPRKGDREQKADARRAELWTMYLGRSADPERITLAEWNRFLDLRARGTLGARGRVASKRKPVGPRTVEADCQWLSIVLNWGTKWYDVDRDRYLLDNNRVRGYPVPHEKNPRRPVATQAQLDELLELGRQPLSDLLVVANGTGRRISAICQLRVRDFYAHHEPHGAILWPADTDKLGKAWFTPVDENVREVMFRRSGPREYDECVFQSGVYYSDPMSRFAAADMLAKACAGIGIPRLGWHAFRRKWASERRHLPPTDVAVAGGWADIRTMQRAYQHADYAGILAVIEGGRA